MNKRQTAGVVRTIFDSCYLRPDENPTVIQDLNPVKVNTMTEATRRFHDHLQESTRNKDVYESGF